MDTGPASARTSGATRRSGFDDRFVTSVDGLRLHARDYRPAGPASGARPLPVLCLPGLARTSADFHALALALSSHWERPRRVIAVDYRGRGLSAYDSNPANYALPVELADVRQMLRAFDIHQAVFIGTSRGGLLAMLMASVQPNLIAGAVLNDIGPVIEPEGLERIKGYIGKLPQPQTLDEGGEILARVFGAQFPNMTPADWRSSAELTWSMSGRRPVLNYDPALSQTLEGFDPAQPLPDMWEQFDALAGIPLMAIRGTLSDLLSAATLDAMRARRPDMTVVEAADEGHPPALGTPSMLAQLEAFCAACDAGHALHR